MKVEEYMSCAKSALEGQEAGVGAAARAGARGQLLVTAANRGVLNLI